MIAIVILIGALSLCVGSFIGLIIATKTKWLDKFNSKDNKISKVLKDPELLKQKIEESYKKVNPDAKGELKMVDAGDVLTLEVKEKDGIKRLDIKRTPYVPPKDSKNILNKIDIK